MNLATTQKQTLKAFILATPSLAALASAQEYNQLATALNQPASPSYWCWRTRVSRAEIYTTTSDLPSDWNWTTYKNQAVAEQNAWTQMFMSDVTDFSRPNVRAGVAAIFSGSAQANAQQAHVLAVARRKATVAEKVFATGGAGSTADPATFVVEGTLVAQDMSEILNS